MLNVVWLLGVGSVAVALGLLASWLAFGGVLCEWGHGGEFGGQFIRLAIAWAIE